MSINYLLLAGVMVLLIICGTVMVNEVVHLYTLTNRIEGKILFSGWAAFSEVDLDTLAERYIITNEEIRDVYLNKSDAADTVRKFIKKNLVLDDAYYPKEESFVPLRTYPVLIDDLQIYNPDDLPAAAPNGVMMNNTSVYISLQFPIHIKFVGDCYKKIDVIVDTKSFYSQFQR